MAWLGAFVLSILGYVVTLAVLLSLGTPPPAWQVAVAMPFVVSTIFVVTLVLALGCQRLLRYLWRCRGTDRT